MGRKWKLKIFMEVGNMSYYLRVFPFWVISTLLAFVSVDENLHGMVAIIQISVMFIMSEVDRVMLKLREADRVRKD